MESGDLPPLEMLAGGKLSLHLFLDELLPPNPGMAGMENGGLGERRAFLRLRVCPGIVSSAGGGFFRTGTLL